MLNNLDANVVNFATLYKIAPLPRPATYTGHVYWYTHYI